MGKYLDLYHIYSNTQSTGILAHNHFFNFPISNQ